jgi:hypothetical protein
MKVEKMAKTKLQKLEQELEDVLDNLFYFKSPKDQDEAEAHVRSLIAKEKAKGGK